MRGVWTLEALMEAWPDGYLLVRSDSKGRPVEALFVVPRHAGSVDPERDASSVVTEWAGKVRSIQTTGKPFTCSVAFYAGDPETLQAWSPLTLSLRERIGIT